MIISLLIMCQAMKESTGFLISDIARLMRREFDMRARRLGVTRAQWRTLLVLQREEGVRQTVLAEKLEVEPITLCRMIDRLAESGLVERRRDPDDRRAWQLYLTPAALPLLEQLHEVGASIGEDKFPWLSKPEEAALTDLLGRIRDSLLEPVEENRKEAIRG